MKIVHDVQSSKRSLLSVNVAVCVSATLMLNKLSDLGFASNRDPIGKCLRRVDWWRHRWRHM